MRPFTSVVLLLACLAAATTPALALQPGDTMQAWKSASESERADILTRLVPEQAIRARVSRCMTDASAITGHGDLPISEVAKACASAGDQPV